MNKNQWDEFFNWLLALFPKWQVTLETSLAWYGELKDFELEECKQAIRNKMTKDDSPFPPGCFEIKKECQILCGVALPNAEFIFDQILDQGVTRDMPEAARIAARNFPDSYARGLMSIDDMNWLRKNFIENYNNLIDFGKVESVALIENRKKQDKLAPKVIKELVEKMSMK